VTVLGVKLLLGLFLTVLSAGFSLAETSFMSLSRQQLTRLAVAHPGRLDFWRRDPDRALAVSPRPKSIPANLDALRAELKS
jgi:CBS domain containing-hemolysin-like protein